jgi:hypothetical protein
MRKILKLISDNVGSGIRKKCKRGYGGACGGLCRSLRLAGVESGGRFCVRAFGSNLALSVICKDSASVN